jgi:hypothetical protein
MVVSDRCFLSPMNDLEEVKNEILVWLRIKGVIFQGCTEQVRVLSVMDHIGRVENVGRTELSEDVTRNDFTAQQVRKALLKLLSVLSLLQLLGPRHKSTWRLGSAIADTASSARRPIRPQRPC